MSNEISTEGFAKESHAHQLQEQYLELLDSLLRTISNAVKAAADWSLGDKNADIRIIINDKELPKNQLTPEQVEQLRQAIEEPEKVKGNVTVKLGEEVVLKVRHGDVKVDRLGIVQAPQEVANLTQASETPQQSPSPQQQQTVSPQVAAAATPLQKNQASSASKNAEELQAEVNELQRELDQKSQKVEQQSERLSTVESKLEALTDTVNNVQDKSISLWLHQTFSTVVQGVKQFVDSWANSNTESTRQLEQQAQPVLQALAQTGKESPSEHLLLQKIGSLENTVKDIQIRFDDSIKTIEGKLVVLEQQIQNLQQNRSVQNDVKATVEPAIEPALGTALAQVEAAQSLEAVKVEALKVENQLPQVERANSTKPAQDFSALQVVTVAEKLLDGLRATNADGLRSFETGNGYRFEKVGSTLTITAPEQGEVVRAVTQGRNRQITLSPQLTSQNAAQLQNIGQKLDANLSENLTKTSQTQSQNQEQNQRQGQGRVRRI